MGANTSRNQAERIDLGQITGANKGPHDGNGFLHAIAVDEGPVIPVMYITGIVPDMTVIQSGATQAPLSASCVHLSSFQTPFAAVPRRERRDEKPPAKERSLKSRSWQKIAN
jgi:hypothetical protein